MNILIIEDEAVVRQALTVCFKRAGCENVDIAETGEEGLGLAVGTRYDLITVDIQLPGASGIDILSVLRNLAPEAVIAIISGFVEAYPKRELELANAIFDKPINAEKMMTLARLSREIAERRDAIRTLGNTQGA